MDGPSFRLRRRHAILLLLAAVGLSDAGCCMLIAMPVAAGLAGGAGTGYFFAKGKVEQTYPAGFVDSWAAAHAALADLGLAIKKEDLKRGIISSRTADGVRVRLNVKEQAVKFPADGPRTRVAVRVGCFGDRAVSKCILHQVALRLAPPVPAENSIAPAPSPVAPLLSQPREKG